MPFGKDLSGLEAGIGYSFRDVTLLETALTHSSFANELKNRGIRKPSNERFEFLGDAVLQLYVSEYLFGIDREFNEGLLTKIRQQTVCGKTLSAIGEALSLGDYLFIAEGKGEHDLRKNPKVCADSFEALVGAIYLDTQGGEEGKRVILSLLSRALESSLAVPDRDYKTRLKNLVEQEGSATLSYLAEEGENGFFVECFVNSNKVGEGKAPTKKEAEQIAARAALELFGILPKNHLTNLPTQ